MNCPHCKDTGIAKMFGNQPEEVCSCVDAWVREKLLNGVWSDLQEDGEFGPALQAAFAAALPYNSEYSRKNDCVQIAKWCDIYPIPTMPLASLIEEIRAVVKRQTLAAA